jgi:STE24 endopeptidase
MQRLSAYFDVPGFPWKNLIISFSVGQYFLESFLSLRQYQVLKQSRPPKALDGAVTQEVYDKSQAYGRAKAKFGAVSDLYGQLQNLGFIYYDVLPRLWELTGTVMIKFAPAAISGEITQSLLFFFGFNLISTVLGLPTSLYHTFVLEEKFGFNKQTPGLFFSDIFKSQALMVVLGSPILAAVLKIIKATGNQAFYYVWLFAIFMQMFMVSVYPILILPLFNKLSPLEEGDLKTGVEALATRLKFPLKHLYVIDGSKRSAHSNAYFYGLPWAKHIVIYDTLIAKSETNEVVAVLAHELGHWSLSHTTKLFGISQAHMFYIFGLFSIFINNNSLYESFGFFKEHPIIIGFILFSDILTPIESVVKLLMNVLSRKFEFEAGKFQYTLIFLLYEFIY